MARGFEQLKTIAQAEWQWIQAQDAEDELGEDEESEVWMGTDAESEEEDDDDDDNEEEKAYYNEIYDQCQELEEPKSEDDEKEEENTARDNPYDMTTATNSGI